MPLPNHWNNVQLNSLLRDLTFCVWMFSLVSQVTSAVAADETPDGLSWPEGQVLPHFPQPAALVDAIAVQSLTREEQLTFAALQGHVNKNRPRIWLINQRSEEGRDTWLETLGYLQ